MVTGRRISAAAAVAPSATVRRGRTRAISWSSHQRQASISLAPGGCERLIENVPCRADERAPGEILPVTRLLADEHHLRRSRAFAEYGLGSVAPSGDSVGMPPLSARKCDRSVAT